jgi:hypothetical protein
MRGSSRGLGTSIDALEQTKVDPRGRHPTDALMGGLHGAEEGVTWSVNRDYSSVLVYLETLDMVFNAERLAAQTVKQMT